jgi:hypothetical protein
VPAHLLLPHMGEALKRPLGRAHWSAAAANQKGKE